MAALVLHKDTIPAYKTHVLTPVLSSPTWNISSSSYSRVSWGKGELWVTCEYQGYWMEEVRGV